MICSNCGTENAPGAKFCSECATRLAVACPTCGTANGPAAKFCSECATPLIAGGAARSGEAGAAASGAGQPVAERRLVSILFADLVGFTPFAEERDAEEVRETLTAYFDLAREVIGRYGGTVEKFIGDAVMAVWGAPVAREDDAERAVRAALDLVEAVAVLGVGVAARAGVLTGEAAVTLGATNQGIVAGDLVNTASRLQSIAPPGAVLVGEATQRAAAAAIAFEEAGEHALKGKASPVPAWRALRVVAQRGGHGRSDLPEPPFVGREDEFRLIKDTLAAVGRDRRTRLLSITGPGGIGKSRLAWEFEKYIDGVAADIFWHRGRSPAYGEGIAFWALGEMVRRRAGLVEGDDDETARLRISATVAEYVPDPDDRTWVEPALLTLLGLEPPPPGGRDMLFAAWRIFFERIATRGSTVLLFEDLQWADSGLLDFIEHVLEWSKGVPMLIVTLARPELFERRSDWGTSTRHSTSLALEPLSDTAMRELLTGFVPGLPDSAVATILARADGVPLYAVETIRTLVADGRLQRDADGYRPVGELGELTIPETLRSLIASRLDALDPIDRSILQDASVLGQVFTIAGLAAVAGGADAEVPPDDLERRLRGLVRRELLEVEADPRSPERGQYRFVQSLIREVAYGTLARRDRRTRHLAAARAFEALGDDELAGALAGHYLAAYEASSPGAEADAVAIQARIALRGAAGRTVALGGHEQALHYLEQALAVTADAAERVGLLDLATVSASHAGRTEQAEGFAREALEIQRASGDPAAIALATARLGETLLNGGRVAVALEVLEDAVVRLPASAPDEARARLLTNLSRAFMRQGLAARAIEIADQALPIAERLRLDQIVAEAFNNKGSGLGYLGRDREALALLDAAVKIAHDGGFVEAELRARNNQASTAFDSEPRRATMLAREALAFSRRVGSRNNLDWVMQLVISTTWLEAGDWDAALEEGDEALAEATDIASRAQLHSSLANIRLSRGDRCDDALEVVEAAASALGDPGMTSNLHAIKADRAVLAGDVRAGMAEWREAAAFKPLAAIYLPEARRLAAWLGDAEEVRALTAELDELTGLRWPSQIAEHHIGAGIADALSGQSDAALAQIRSALETYRDIGWHFFVARTVLDALRALGPAIVGESMVSEARSTFESVGATPYLAWLAEATSGRPAKRAGSQPSTSAPSAGRASITETSTPG